MLKGIVLCIEVGDILSSCNLSRLRNKGGMRVGVCARLQDQVLQT